MTFELTILAWTCVLAIVQIFLPTFGRTRQLGPKWNLGPRDEPLPEPDAVTGRLERARNNLLETLPLFIAAVLIAHVAGREGTWTHWGAGLYLAGRLAYVPLYAFGVSGARSLVFCVSLAGIVIILIRVLIPG